MDLGLLRSTSGDPATDVLGVTMDSRQVEPGALFACVPGRKVDGHMFAPAAVADGAVALLVERPLELGVAQVQVSSARRSLGPISDAFFGHPSRDLLVAGVTGTNGKTTTCAFLAAIFEANGWSAMTIGTLTQPRTTPEAPELHALLDQWRRDGGQAVAMEVSSHALEQHRTDAVRFAAGVFTNLSPEHLDYHETMDAYFDAKALLFEPGRVELAVINRSDTWGQKLIERVIASGSAPVTYSLDDVTDVELDTSGIRFRWEGQRFILRVGGAFNVSNAVAAAATAKALGVDPSTAVDGLAALRTVPGRFEMVDAGQEFSVVVDYAHTPDGLSKVLSAAREITSGRLIVVFGAGGDRDREKRPSMGGTAASLADLAVVTSDNPRSEDPDSIIADILAGAGDRANVIVDRDRAAAIATALANARPGDIVVIAGKGHEKGQEIGSRILPFDDVEVAREALQRILLSRQENS